MQHQLFFKLKSQCAAMGTFVLLFFCTFLLFNTAANAQPVTPPSFLETAYAYNNTPLYTLNTDMLEMYPGKQLEVVTYDQYLFSPTVPPGVVVKVMDYTGATDSIFIKAATESKPDVVLADDLSSPGRYFAGVVYIDVNGMVHFDTYYVLGAGTGTLTLKPFTTDVISANKGIFPHIDMFADPNTPIGAYPSMHKFAISYGEFLGSMSIDIFERNGDMSNPYLLSSPLQITFGEFCTDGADIAVSYDPGTNLQYAYFAGHNSLTSSLYEAEVVLDPTLPPFAPPISGPAFTPLYSGTINPLLPRIEAMGINKIGTGIVPWVIGSIIADPVTFKNQIWEYNVNMLGGFNCTTPTLASEENLSVAVCAGSGWPFGNVCNDNYNIGWHNSKVGYITQVVDATTGAISVSDPNYYKADMLTPAITWIKVPIALSSCSNSGNDMLTAWWDNANTIYYKLKPNITGYKPGVTGIRNVLNGTAFSVSPNPATDNLSVEGLQKADYSIINTIGQTIGRGSIHNTKSTIDISGLSSGSYNLMIYQNKESKNVKFVKQ